jgi:hypothetical protein
MSMPPRTSAPSSILATVSGSDSRLLTRWRRGARPAGRGPRRAGGGCGRPPRRRRSRQPVAESATTVPNRLRWKISGSPS